MFAIYKSLIWKEWHEHKWKLASLLAVCLVPPILLTNDKGMLNFLGAAAISSLFYVPLAAAFMGMSTAANEHSRGTNEFQASLPTQLVYPGAVKLLAGWLATLVPLLILMIAVIVCNGMMSDDQSKALSNALAQDSETRWMVVRIILSVVAASGSIYLWVAALGVNSESEIRAGAIGLSVIVAVWGLFALCSYVSHSVISEQPVRWFWEWVAPAMPGGIASNVPSGLPATHGYRNLPIFCITHLPLLGWYLYRYGQSEPLAFWQVNLGARENTETGQLAPPRHSPFKAILWKQWRESAVVAIFAAMAALGIGLLIATILTLSESQFASDEPGLTRFFNYSMEAVMGALVFAGALSALVAGVGAFVTDLRSKLHTFWRSRPIDPDLWFWTKFWGGLTALAAAFILPSLLAGSALHLFGRREIDEPLLFATVAAGVICLTYVAAVLAGCLIRHAVYASLLGFLLAIGLLQTAAAITDSPILITLMGVTATVAMSVLAWLSVRYDWALRR